MSYIQYSSGGGGGVVSEILTVVCQCGGGAGVVRGAVHPLPPHAQTPHSPAVAPLHSLC